MVEQDSDSDEDDDDESDGSSDGQGFNKRMLAERLALRSEERYTQQVSKSIGTPTGRNSLTLQNARNSQILSSGGRSSLTLNNDGRNSVSLNVRGSLTLTTATNLDITDDGDADAQFPIDPPDAQFRVDPCILTYDVIAENSDSQDLSPIKAAPDSADMQHTDSSRISQGPETYAQQQKGQAATDSQEQVTQIESGSASTSKDASIDAIVSTYEPFWSAARDGDVTALAEALKTGMDVSFKDPADKECTALHMAAAAGHVECVRFLLDKGADPQLQNAFDDTPMHGAAFKGHVQVHAYIHTNTHISTPGIHTNAYA
jgi:hypothetical protein